MNEYITANNLDQKVDFETHQMEILLRTVDYWILRTARSGRSSTSGYLPIDRVVVFPDEVKEGYTYDKYCNHLHRAVIKSLRKRGFKAKSSRTASRPYYISIAWKKLKENEA